ncbi:response regulator [Methylobacterium sp. 77]|uniref:response regulator transcription factor n=1 Tax=Methylobacterium sp. 77 TaxID=1101192 RepID=UPI00037B9C8C|nr:response regulator [Methylobacterium sp. 77]
MRQASCICSDRNNACKVNQMPSIPVIAIIDDDEDVRKATESLIRSLGYVARTYASASDYLKPSQQKSADCLITDVQMPDMTGIELYQRIIATGSKIPVIFVTAFPTEALRNRALAAGACGFLSKPCDGATIIRSLEEALRGH